MRSGMQSNRFVLWLFVLTTVSTSLALIGSQVLGESAGEGIGLVEGSRTQELSDRDRAMQAIPVSTSPTDISSSNGSFTFTVTSDLDGKDTIRVGTTNTDYNPFSASSPYTLSHTYPTTSGRQTSPNIQATLKPMHTAPASVPLYFYRYGVEPTVGNEEFGVVVVKSDGAKMKTADGRYHPTPTQISLTPAYAREISKVGILGGLEGFDCTVEIDSLVARSHDNFVWVDCTVIQGNKKGNMQAHRILKSPSGRWPYKLKFTNRRSATFAVRTTAGHNATVRIYAYPDGAPSQIPSVKVKIHK